MKKTSKPVALLAYLQTLFPEKTKDELYALTVCGEVLVQGERIRDPLARVDNQAAVELVSRRFVSRGGEKLEGVLDLWNLPIAGGVFLDAGASTGGFTDCLLKKGAALVHAVDVGRGQLAQSLRVDPRVNNLEGTNLMGLETLNPQPWGAVCDLSFRSLRRAAAKALGLTSQGWLVALLKPQFELTEDSLDFDGVLNPAQVPGVVERTLEDLKAEGVWAHRIAASPIKGRKGNQEFLVLLSVAGPGDQIQEDLRNLWKVD